VCGVVHVQNGDPVNVVLVDGADTQAPTVQTELIDPRLPGDGDALTRALGNTPERLTFIQCDAAPPQLSLNADPRARATQMAAASIRSHQANISRRNLCSKCRDETRSGWSQPPPSV
jgi:hypothetical protein